MSPPNKDEGYISAANHIGSPATASPVGGQQTTSMGAIDELMSEGEFFSNHRRIGSGNSHGMSSPLYDGATGSGMDRIQSKDIVALMEHVGYPLKCVFGLLRHRALHILKQVTHLGGAADECDEDFCVSSITLGVADSKLYQPLASSPKTHFKG